MRIGHLAGLLIALSAAVPSPLAAQSWRLRLESSAQRMAFRGVTPDSVLQDRVVAGPTGGPVSPDGYAVTCGFDAYCRFYRAGPVHRALPASASTELTLWGLGVPGLSLRVNVRLLGDLTGDRIWPGPSPAFRLVEGYAEYLRGGLVARAGRLVEPSRLGSAGGVLDGARATWRFDRTGLEAGGYAGWGFARGTTLPVTSPAVNPLADFQPGKRQIVAGVLAGIRREGLEARAEYRREVDPATDYFVSERAALSVAVAPSAGVRLAAGAERDLGQGHWGSADFTVTYAGHDVWATAAVRHYHPFFDLWTVWGAFSPVPFNAVSGSLAGRPVARLQLRGRAEWFRYQPTETSTPAVTVRDGGWQLGATGRLELDPRWSVEAGVHAERRPGASSQGADGQVTWHPAEALDISLGGGTLDRPLEFRFQDAGLTWVGGAVEWRSGERWRVGGSVDRYWDARDRPDAASFDWNQWRLSARVSLTLRSGADRWTLPPARRDGGRP
jgi:hypothetical protein